MKKGEILKAIKLMATVDKQGSLSLDFPLSIVQNSRVEVIVLIPESVKIDEEEETIASKAEILKDFSQGWHEAMTGKTIPISELWEGIENV